MHDYYHELVKKAEEKYPNLEDRYCRKCGDVLVRGSINYYEGIHIDGCPCDELVWED